MTTQEKFQYREQLVTDAIELREPDRVPVVPLISAYPLFAYGKTMKDNMYDPRGCFEAYLQFHRDFEPDLAFGNPCIFSGKAMDIMQPTFLKWPGEKGGLPDDTPSYQFLETVFPCIKDDEWDEVLNDKTGWFLSKYMPRNFKTLAPLSGLKLDYTSLNGFMNLWALGNSSVIGALEKLKVAIQEAGMYMMSILELGNLLTNMGYPGMIGGSIMCPFDMLGDMALGTEESMIALIERPEEVLELTNRLADDLVKQANDLGKQGRSVKKIWLYLHKGMDEFMSDAQYRKFYFDPMMKVINALIDNGLTPVLQCQGNYYTRLEHLQDLPKGKCICFFEKMDMGLAKKKLGGKVCIGGNLKGSMLQFGKKEDVIAETKRLIDLCGPGGGYIFSTDVTIDAAKRENLEAMFDTALTYGKK